MRSIPRPPPAAPARRAAPGAAADARRLHALLVALSRHRSLRDPVSAACAEHHLSSPQVHTLLALGRDGPLPMGDLARRAGVTEKTATGLVDRLERDGLVRRGRDGADRRVVQVHATDDGAGLARRLDDEILATLVRLLGRLDAGERRDLFRLVTKLTGLTDLTEDA
jgi:DNA-binding MarR family transcriptional regulator